MDAELEIILREEAKGEYKNSLILQMEFADFNEFLRFCRMDPPGENLPSLNSGDIHRSEKRSSSDCQTAKEGAVVSGYLNPFPIKSWL